MEETIRKRYFSKAAGGLLGGGGNFFAQKFLCNSIGLQNYGQYTFIMAHLEPILGQLDFGLQDTFFSLISQKKQRYPSAAAAYTTYLFLLGLGILAYIFLVTKTGLAASLWPEIDPKYMLAGFFLVYSVFLSRVIIFVSDLAGIAFQAERLRVYRSLVTVGTLYGLYRFGILGLGLGMVVMATGYLLFIFYCFQIGHRALGAPQLDYRWASMRQRFNEYKPYRRSYLSFGIITLFTILFDRWILQHAGGATQQGYFGIGYQCALAITVITGAFVPIFHRELGVAYGAENLQHIRVLLERFQQRFFTMAAVGAIYLASCAPQLVQWFTNSQSTAGALAMALLFLYPIHQTSGRLAQAVLLATNRNKTYVRIALFKEILGIPIVYFFVAAPHWMIPGLGYGAFGLALKQLICQFINTSLDQVANAKYLGISFHSQFFREMKLLAFLSTVAGIGYWQTHLVLGTLESKKVLYLAISFSFYSLFVGIGAILFPQFFGLSKDHVREVFGILKGRFRFAPE